MLLIRGAKTRGLGGNKSSLAPRGGVHLVGGRVAREAQQQAGKAMLVGRAAGLGPTATALGCRVPLWQHHNRNFAVKVIKVPPMGDSITEGSLQKWVKNPGEFVHTDDIVASIETDKVTVEVRAPEPGQIVEVFAKEEDSVLVNADLFSMETDVELPKEQPKAEKPKEAPKEKQKEVKKEAEKPKEAAKTEPREAPKAEQKPKEATRTTLQSGASREEHRQKMSRMRLRIAERLRGAQSTYAMLTTFNEVDMSELMSLRNSFKDEFFEKHGVKLGFMSAFVKASAVALREQPIVNAVIDGDEILHRDYVDISVAVATGTGLVVPVLRDCDQKSFADIEKEIGGLGKKARDGTMSLEEMTGGTFTISNGGVYGSMMGTPIINPPQSAILGMHAINKRAVVVDDQIVIRPMMYLALTYDHRLIDGKDAVTFLKRIRDIVQDPRRFLLV